MIFLKDVFKKSASTKKRGKFIDLLPNLNLLNEVYLRVCEIYIRISFPLL